MMQSRWSTFFFFHFFFCQVVQSGPSSAQAQDSHRRTPFALAFDVSPDRPLQTAVVAVVDRLLAQWVAMVPATASLTASQGGDAAAGSSLERTASASSQTAENLQPAAKKARADSSAAAVVKSASLTATAKEATPAVPRAVSRAGSVAAEKLADPVRERAVQMLAEALTLEGGDAAAAAAATAGDNADDYEADPAQTAAAIERALFEKHGGDTGVGYKQQMRSLNSNIKNKKNPGLRKSIMVGELTPRDLVSMSVHDLADPELVEQRRKDAEWATKVAMGPALSQAAPTDAFVCPRCKQRKCRYIMLQTRSADEPMTTFITCANCGHHWRNG